MPKNFYHEKLLYFKSNEKPEAVLLIADKPLLIRITVAWMNMRPHRRQHVSRLEATSDDAAWEWLWANTRFSKETLLKRIPAADPKTEAMVDALIANRVLYPDGTVHSFVGKYLRKQVLKHFTPRIQIHPKSAVT